MQVRILPGAPIFPTNRIIVQRSGCLAFRYLAFRSPAFNQEDKVQVPCSYVTPVQFKKEDNEHHEQRRKTPFRTRDRSSDRTGLLTRLARERLTVGASPTVSSFSNPDQ
jgi:hypothetical protein